LDRDGIRDLLHAVRSGELPVDEALDRLRFLAAADLGFARVDRQRAARCGFPEVIYCPGKLPEEVAAIAREIVADAGKLLATRVSPEHVRALRREFPDAVHHERARAVTVRRGPRRKAAGAVLVLSAGSADIAVAEEAAVTAEIMDSAVERIYDVGVAGIHRLLACREALQRARVIVVVAGMEGALPSVVGGLVDRPVIAVPTSVGYGVSLGGVAPLLTMLSSCAAGVTVVNIDNGFGAGYAAALINDPPGLREDRGEGSDDRA
jgi:NCAIR mutase (PurE)-related protein